LDSSGTGASSGTSVECGHCLVKVNPAMPCLIKILTPTGLHDVAYTADSLKDAVQFEPRDGIYTIANTFDTFKTLKLGAHLDRLEQSAQIVGIPLTLDRAALRAALRAMIQEAGYGDVRFRVTVPRETPTDLILSIEPFHALTAHFFTDGIRVVTTAQAERHDPAAKTTDWMHARASLEDSLPTGIYTALLVSPTGAILEGVGSNFYAVYKDELRTAGEGVLAGISQQIVFEVAPSVIPVRREAIQLADIPLIEEAFITSSSRGIVPVVEIDGYTIGTGKPGARTLSLRAHYSAWMNSHLEEL